MSTETAVTDESRIRTIVAIELEHLGCDAGGFTDARLGAIVPYLAEVEGEIRVIDAAGNVRTVGDNPMSVRQLILELIGDPQRGVFVRWAPFGVMPA